MSDRATQATVRRDRGPGAHAGCRARATCSRAAGACAVTDTRAAPPELAALRALDPRHRRCASAASIRACSTMRCASWPPRGCPLADPFFAEARRRGLDDRRRHRAVRARRGRAGGRDHRHQRQEHGDHAGRPHGRSAPVCSVRVGGNLGEPALDCCCARRTPHRAVRAGAVQLPARDHAVAGSARRDGAERHARSPGPLRLDLASYAAAKARIFARCDTAVINLDDPLVVAMPRAATRTLGFSLRASIGADYAVADAGRPVVADARGEPLLARREHKITGLHNAANALAALALGEALGLPLPRDARRACEASRPCRIARSGWPRSHGVAYIDDSKGTNVGATLAAVAGMAGPLVVIAGGDGKNQDFSAAARRPSAARCATWCSSAATRRNWRVRSPASARSSCAGSLPEAVRAAAPPRGPVTPCCCRRPARASTCSATTRTAARCSPPACGSLPHERQQRLAHGIRALALPRAARCTSIR